MFGKAGDFVDKAVRYLLCAALSFLFVLACASLVESPPVLGESKPAQTEIPADTVFEMNEIAAVNPTSGEIHQEKTQLFSTQAVKKNVTVKKQPVCDGNGSPLTSGNYVRNAYNACPPEDMPG